MPCLRKGLVNWHHESIGSGLQLGPAALLHLTLALSQSTEELPQFLLNLRLGPKTGIRCDILSRPIPDRLVPVEVGTVRWQRHQHEIQVRCGKIAASGSRWFARIYRRKAADVGSVSFWMV